MVMYTICHKMSLEEYRKESSLLLDSACEVKFWLTSDNSPERRPKRSIYPFLAKPTLITDEIPREEIESTLFLARLPNHRPGMSPLLFVPCCCAMFDIQPQSTYNPTIKKIFQNQKTKG
jgi:hypothetical protein